MAVMLMDVIVGKIMMASSKMTASSEFPPAVVMPKCASQRHDHRRDGTGSEDTVDDRRNAREHFHDGSHDLSKPFGSDLDDEQCSHTDREEMINAPNE